MSRGQIERQRHLERSVKELEIEAIEELLKSGCDPNINPSAQFATRTHGFLHDLAHRYSIERTLKGKEILGAAEKLLKFGADPNQPGDCISAPIQLCTTKHLEPFRNLLLKYGAKPEGNPRF